MSFKTGIFPQVCKMATIIPIYKKGDKLQVTTNLTPIECWKNYRTMYAWQTLQIPQ